MSELKQVTQPLEPEVDDPVKAAAELLPSGATELTIPEALDLAVRMLRQDRLDGARTIFERVLQAVPEHPDALSMLGLLEHRIGRTDVGLPLMRRAVELLPDFVGFPMRGSTSSNARPWCSGNGWCVTPTTRSRATCWPR
jgi:tetratricopeptide (TPR) repeat protein